MSIVHSNAIPRTNTTYAAQGTGRPIVIELDISDVGGETPPVTDDWDIEVTDTIEVVDVLVIKNGAGAGNTLQLKNGANAITDAIAATTDKAITRAGTIDRTQSTIAAGGTLRFTVSRAAGTGAMKVFVYCVVKTNGAPSPTAP